MLLFMSALTIIYDISDSSTIITSLLCPYNINKGSFFTIPSNLKSSYQTLILQSLLPHTKS